MRSARDVVCAEMISMALSGAVLIGGRSRRMGTPKALLRLTDRHPTLLEQIVSVVERVASDVMLVGTPTWQVPASLTRLRSTSDGGDGPADGIVATLKVVRHECCFVVGCDMPFLDPALLNEMAERAQRDQRGVIVRDSQGTHALHALWLRSDLPRIEALVAGGERRLEAIAKALSMSEINLDDRGDAARWSVFNVNTPADLEIARSHAASVGS